MKNSRNPSIVRNLTFALAITLCLLIFIARAEAAQLANAAMAELYISIMDACEG